MEADQNHVCAHFGECGGCQFQDLDYPAQLRNKSDFCQKLLQETRLKIDLEPIVPSPAIFYYRNKMEFSFGEENGELICGLHRRGRRRELFDLRECRIFSEEAPRLLSAVREYARASGLPAYSSLRHRGFWRNLIIRESKFAGQTMVNLVTSSQGVLDLEKLKNTLSSSRRQQSVTTLIWTQTDRRAEAVIPEKVEVLEGAGYIEERMEGLIFRIYPYSFFQVNVSIVNEFYRKLRKLLALSGNEQVVDVFCGMGPLSLVLAPAVKMVWGIEKEAEAVANAQTNASLNRIGNVAFLAGAARKVLLERREQWRNQIDVLVINPPRAGANQKVIKRIKEIAPRTVVYSSCNPLTFFAEIQYFLDNYEVESMQPFDFFPHTPHLEILSILHRKT